MPSRDPEKNRKAVRDHYYRHKERVLAKVHKVNARVRLERGAWITAFKVQAGCAHCGEKDPIVLQFHHCIGEKDFPVSRMTIMSLSRVKAEIAKCIVLCANCHLREHARLRALSPTEEASDLGSEC